MIYWNGYRACPVCKAHLGEPCMSLSSAIINGRPDGKATVAEKPHSSRKRRTSAKQPA